MTAETIVITVSLYVVSFSQPLPRACFDHTKYRGGLAKCQTHKPLLYSRDCTNQGCPPGMEDLVFNRDMFSRLRGGRRRSQAGRGTESPGYVLGDQVGSPSVDGRDGLISKGLSSQGGQILRTIAGRGGIISGAHFA